MTADLFHYGHVNFLKNASLVGDQLIVGIHSDKVVEEYKDVCKKLHDRGISINGTFIFGMDSHNKDIFKKLGILSPGLFCGKNVILLKSPSVLAELPNGEPTVFLTIDPGLSCGNKNKS